MKIKWILIGIVILLLVVGATVFFLMSRQVNQLAKQDFSLINIATIPDGTYQGSASAVLVTASAEVTVRNGRIIDVKLLKHSHGPGYGAEALCAHIVEANSPDVDGISGATASSTIVKSAVLEALQSRMTP